MPRNRQQTASRIKQAAKSLLEREGFVGWGINAIARNANADKVLIYRYFNSLEGLLTEIISETVFWPNPENVNESSAEEFIAGTTRHIEADAVARLLLALPESHPCCSLAREKFSHDLDIWVAGFRDRCDGYITESQLFRLPALIHFQSITGDHRLSSSDLWQQVSPPLMWRSVQEFQAFEDLPTELL